MPNGQLNAKMKYKLSEKYLQFIWFPSTSNWSSEARVHLVSWDGKMNTVDHITPLPPGTSGSAKDQAQAQGTGMLIIQKDL